MTAFPLENGKVKLDWVAASTTETHFHVECSLDASQWFDVGQPDAGFSTLEVSDLPDGLMYYFRMRAEQTITGQLVHMSSWTVPVAVTTTLRSPSNLSVSRSGPHVINLQWTDNSSAESAYEIQRRVDAGDWEVLDTLAANVTAYYDTELIQNGHTFTYRVAALQAGFAEAASAQHGIALPSLTLDLLPGGESGDPKEGDTVRVAPVVTNAPPHRSS